MGPPRRSGAGRAADVQEGRRDRGPRARGDDHRRLGSASNGTSGFFAGAAPSKWKGQVPALTRRPSAGLRLRRPRHPQWLGGFLFPVAAASGAKEVPAEEARVVGWVGRWLITHVDREAHTSGR